MITTSLAKPQGQKYETTSILSMAILFYQFGVCISVGATSKIRQLQIGGWKERAFVTLTQPLHA